MSSACLSHNLEIGLLVKNQFIFAFELINNCFFKFIFIIFIKTYFWIVHGSMIHEVLSL